MLNSHCNECVKNEFNDKSVLLKLKISLFYYKEYLKIQKYTHITL